MNAITDYVFADQKNFHGWVDPRFHDLVKYFSRLQDHRSDQGGAALAVYFRGEKVVDIFTGKKSKDQQWSEQTLSICYSTGKGILATLAHILVSEGRLDYDQAISEYWADFSQQPDSHGKSTLTLRQVLSHQSGLFDIRNNIAKASEMSDWNHMLNVMANAVPRFDVGRENAYQALTFGWLVGGALEKATGMSLQMLFKQYLSDPLGLDGAYFGVPASELDRVAKPFNYKSPLIRDAEAQKQSQLVESHSKTPKKQKVSVMGKLIELSGQNSQDFQDAMVPKAMRSFSFYDDSTIQSIIPAANGAFTARSLAKVYAMLANRGVWGGQTLINSETFKALSTIQSFHRDRVMPIPMRWRLGYHRVLTLGKRASQGFGHIGYNGSGAWCDPERELSFAYTHNFPTGSITGDYRLWGLSQETLRCADKILKGSKGWF